MEHISFRLTLHFISWQSEFKANVYPLVNRHEYVKYKKVVRARLLSVILIILDYFHVKRNEFMRARSTRLTGKFLHCIITINTNDINFLRANIVHKTSWHANNPIIILYKIIICIRLQYIF